MKGQEIDQSGKHPENKVGDALPELILIAHKGLLIILMTAPEFLFL